MAIAIAIALPASCVLSSLLARIRHGGFGRVSSPTPPAQQPQAGSNGKRQRQADPESNAQSDGDIAACTGGGMICRGLGARGG